MSVNTSARRFPQLPAVMAALAASLVLVASSSALAQGRHERGGGPPPHDFRGPDGPRGYDGPTEATAKAGFVFVDGEYLPPPYDIRFAGEDLSINGRKLTCIPPPPIFFGRGFGGHGSQRGGEQSWRHMVLELKNHLSNEAVVMSFANQPFFVLDTSTAYDLLKSMTMQAERSVRQVSVRERLPDGFDKQIWDDWIDGFKPPENLRQRAAVLINKYDETQREALEDIRARRWLEALSYPLSVSGMVMSVLAIGHLLGGRPHAGRPTFGLDPSPEMIHALNWSLFFTAAFSSIDLLWTIAASSTNDITELNPIGSQFIHDPRHLAGFKVGMTFSCLAVLWLLRKHKRAQIAAWWVCLVLTLVTCRWLMVNSLFTSAL